jgi:3-hydroxyisobutyrate dehydrogenase-like beta-hydroxyacid dehydrogenase
MAARLLACGHELVAWNRTPAAGEALAAIGGSIVARPGETLETEVVITMLADDAAVEAVWITSGLIDRIPLSTVHVNMASVSLALAQRMTRLHGDRGAPYVSAPVFGRPQFAESGQLDIVAAGPRQAMGRCTPLFEALSKQWFDLGDEPARANIVKIARNFLLGTLIESLGEAFALVGKSGVDPTRFLEIITSTSFNAPAYKSYGRLMLEPPDKPTFTLTLGMKDIELALAAGGETRVPMPMAALIREQHLAAINQGYGDHDWAALGNYIARSAGL